MLLIILLSSLTLSEADLRGDHICQVEERYTVNVTQHQLRNATVRTYKWCMNVPPRCSEYKIREVNETKYVLEDRLRLVDECCPGFIEDETNAICISQCQNCTHGECQSDNTCNCHSGFHGRDCDQVCAQNQWGPNCTNNCTCKRGECSATTGQCTCPQGWFGKRCENQCADNCNCDSETGICPYATESYFANTTLTPNQKRTTPKKKRPHLQKYYTFTVSQTENEKTSEVPLTETTSVTTAIPTTKLTTTSTAEFSTSTSEKEYPLVKLNTNETYYNAIPTTEKVANEKKNTSKEKRTTTTPVPFTVAAHDVTGQQEADKAPVVAKSNIVNESKAKGTLNSLDNMLQGDEWLNDEFDAKAIDQNAKLHENDNKHVTLILTITGLVTIIVIITIGIIAFVRVLKRNGAQAESKAEKNNDKTTVSVFAKSIFHTPLPEPPILENPIFLTPAAGIGGFESSIETRVVCNISFPNKTNKREDQELFYDHPPSTGSYRAATKLEPPKIDEVCTIEPLYDEIPCWITTPHTITYEKNKYASLYMNTDDVT